MPFSVFNGYYPCLSCPSYFLCASCYFYCSLEPEEKETLIDIINKLLQDKSTLVAGSAVHAFEEVCPDRFDLIHK